MVFCKVTSHRFVSDKIANETIYQPSTRQFGSFDKGTSQQQYPTSLMGSNALPRQTLSDAQCTKEAYGKEAYNGKFEFNAALDALKDIEQTSFSK